MDPVIEVSVMGQKKFTTAKDDIGITGRVSWNEHLFFEPKNVVRYINLKLNMASLRSLIGIRGY